MNAANSLIGWFQSEVAVQGVASRRTLLMLTALKGLRAFALMGAYWFFAALVSGWIVDGTPATFATLGPLSVCLGLVWLCQVLADLCTRKAKLTLLSQLEGRLHSNFARHQHALIRQHSGYHWQTLWLHHLPALVHWHYDYRVQQGVAAAVPLMALAAIFSVNGLIGLGLLVTLPVVPVFMVIVGRGAASLHRKHFIALERLGRLFADRLAALPLLASLQAHDHQQAMLHSASNQLNQRTMKVVSVAFLSNTVLDFFATLAVALVAVFIGFSLLGQLSLGPPINLHQGLWILLCVPLLLSEMKTLGQFYHQKAQAQAASEQLGSLLNPPSPVKSSAETFAGTEIRDFCMQSPRLTAPRLSIPKGSWIQLNGRSGAGKSSLLEALCGLREASHQLPAECLLLTQQPALLPASLRHNLCLGQAAEDKRLWEVLAQVELSEWAQRLPRKLDTLLGEQVPLSGGEAQRLALARVLLRNAEICLLDEPTAHLSEPQHERLAQLIRHCCQGKTVIWASHKALPGQWFTHSWDIQQHRVMVR